MSDGGKGDKRRKGADDAKYAEGWDKIFGKRHSGDTKGNSNKEGTNQPPKEKHS